jgi:putative sterol carrier protein
LICGQKIGVNEESFVVDLKNLKVYKGKCEGKPDATFSFADADFMAVSSGSMNPQMAFIRGKMKIKGSMSAAQKFTPDIFPKPSKL